MVLQSCCPAGSVIHSELFVPDSESGFWAKCKDAELLEVPGGDVVSVFPFFTFYFIVAPNLFDNVKTFPKQHEV